MSMARLPGSSAPPAGMHPPHVPLTLPACLRLTDSPLHGVGVFAAAPLPLGLRLGPYGGRPVRADSPDGTGREYSWRVRHGRLVDAGDWTHSNWMQFVNCAPHAARRNLLGFQRRGALYFRTVAPVVVGEELLVYYGDDYASSVDIDGCYDYVPPKEESDSEFAATSDEGGDAGDDYECIGVDDLCDYNSPKEELEPKLGCSDGDADDDYGPPDIDDYGSPEEDPESKVIDVFYHPVKEEPELEIAATHGDGGADYAPNIGVDTHPPKEEPELELTTTGDDVNDRGRNVGYDCSHCRISLSTREFRVEHELRCKVQMKRKKLESQITKLYYCGYCRCPFISEEFKEQHQQKYCRKRPVAKRKDSSSTCFECNKCKFSTKRKRNLTKHVLTHNKNNAEWFTCTQCPYKAVQKSTMTRHMKIHSNTFSCCCPICGKSFRAKQNLDIHLLRQHFDESDQVSTLITSKIYACDICDQFRTVVKSYYNQHVSVTHNKGVECQKYQCPCCPYFTFFKMRLTRHSKTHVGEKDYQCAVCKRQFMHKPYLDSHILSYHADNVDLVKTITSKMHGCALCSYKTVVLTNLKKHVRLNHF